MRKLFTLLFISLSLYVVAAIPTGYYNSAEGKTGAELKTALFNIVSSHTALSYADLWTAFQTTDKRIDGYVWDMYSNCSFTFVTNQDSGSGGTAECQYYNREHSFPKSWFNDDTPMYTDLFHLYPTDKYVNNQRGNSAFGETSTPTKTFINGSKVGSCTFSGFTGTIYEPADSYKGDFARTYFYMVTAYEDKITSWTGTDAAQMMDVTSSTTLTYPSFKQWAINLLLKWNTNDAVSDKEKNRNDVIYTNFQHNRNPYIDHQELAEYIWGSKKGVAWSISTGIDTPIRLDMKIKVLREERTITLITDNTHLFTYTIFDISGKSLQSGTAYEDESISVANLSAGIYIIHVTDGEGSLVQKFVL
jgi:endonuclease I